MQIASYINPVFGTVKTNSLLTAIFYYDTLSKNGTEGGR
jgi:hypothetical protein